MGGRISKVFSREPEKEPTKTPPVSSKAEEEPYLPPENKSKSTQVFQAKPLLYVNYPKLQYKGEDPPEYTTSGLEKFPKELKLYILSLLEVQHLVKLRRVSKFWRYYADIDSLWQTLCDAKGFTKPGNTISVNNQTWKETYIVLSAGRWDSKFNPEMKVDGNIVKHVSSVSVCYLAVRTDAGLTRGRHYWEYHLLNLTFNGYNSYFGISNSKLRPKCHLGQDAHSLGMRGRDCVIYWNARTFVAAPKVAFPPKSRVGVCIDFEEKWILFFLNGQPITQKLKLNSFFDDVVYPSLSMVAVDEYTSLETFVPPSGKIIDSIGFVSLESLPLDR